MRTLTRWALLAVLPLVAAGLSVPTAADEAVERAEAAPGAVVEKRLVGRSVRGRPIWAYRMGEEPRRGVPTVVLLSTMHGDEPDTRHLLFGLKDGRPVRGIDLWIVPTYNPDGQAQRTRRNANGVDLNRNFPFRWKDLDGPYESGPRPASEPETRAMMAFLRDVRPDWILSFHQPLLGVDTDFKKPWFARKVARFLDLPTKTISCGGVCHGTLTMWYNARFRGAALTVEYGARPSRRMLRGDAARQVLRIFGARRPG